MALTKVKAGNIILTTPSSSSNDTTPATTQYVTTAINDLIDTAPSTLNTLNELAAALGDDVNFSTTVTNSIATKLPLAGGTLTGPLAVSPATGTAKISFTSQGVGSEVFSVNGQIPGVNNTGFAIRNETDSRNDFMLDGSGNATFAGTISSGAITSTGAIKAYGNSDTVAGLEIYSDSNHGMRILHRGTDGDFSFERRVNGTNTEFLRISRGTGNATFAGTISGGAITADGNVTIKGDNGFNATGETASIYLGDGNSEIRATYDGGTKFFLNGTDRMEIEGGTGNLNLKTGNLEINGTTVLTSARNLQNIGTITSSSLFTNTYANGNISSPSTSDHTAGTRQVYYDGSATAWYARGIESNTLWDNTDNDWKLYRQAILRLHWSESAGTFSVNHGTPIVRLADTSSSGAMEMKVDGIAAYVTNKSTNGGLYLQTNNPRDQYVHINGTAFYSESFALNNGTQYDFDIDVGSEGGSGNSFFVIAGYNHYYNTTYGAHKIAFMSARTTSMNTMINVGDQSSAGGGAWQFTKPSSGVLRVRKTAGTYVGGGHGFITVIFRAL